jgi:putative hemolysin
MNRIALALGLASLLSVTSLVGCAAESEPAPSNGAQSSEIGLANPAAVNCTKLGYTLSGDQCVFPDGTSCEQWAFFRGECSAPAPKPAPNPTPNPTCTPIPGPNSGPGVGMANPASVYCEGAGGTTTDSDCVFSDGTKCEQWSFYRGECGQAHSFCNQNGGQISNVQEDMGGWTASYAKCTLPSGDSCEESEFAQSCGCL